MTQRKCRAISVTGRTSPKVGQGSRNVLLALHDISFLPVVLNSQRHRAPVGRDGHVVRHMWVARPDTIVFRFSALRPADVASRVIEGMAAVVWVGITIVIHGGWCRQDSIVRRAPSQCAHVRGSVAATCACCRRFHWLRRAEVLRVGCGWALLWRARVGVKSVATHGACLSRLVLLEVGTHVWREGMILGQVSIL